MPFPWQQAMAFAFGRLGLAPPVFWAMTPRELAAAMSVLAGGNIAAPSRGGLAQMMAAFPD